MSDIPPTSGATLAALRRPGVGPILNLLVMRIEPRQSRIVAALVYCVAAAYSAASLWFVLSSAFSLNEANRNALLLQMRSVLIAWLIVCGVGVLFTILALRFANLSVGLRRTILVASCAVAVIAGVCLEWWQSLYFLFPAFALALGSRETVHP